MKKLEVIAFVFLSLNIQAQSSGLSGMPRISTEELIPKSPQAAQFQKVNDPSINNAKGTAIFNFSLYTSKVGNNSIPISISYDASGIKYDDIPGVLGLKWTLNVGGEVSRNINGKPDETHYFQNAQTYTLNYLNNINLGTSSGQIFYQAVANNNIDITHDNYNYVSPTGSGSIIFKNGKFWDANNPNTVKVLSNLNLDTFKIIDSRGNVSYFYKPLNEINTVNYTGNGYVTPNIPSEGITSWKVGKIEFYNKENVSFEYEDYNYTYTKLAEESWTNRTTPAPFPGTTAYNCNCGVSGGNKSYFSPNYFLKNIKKISTPNEEVNFYYSINNNLAIYKKQLDSIKIYSKYTNSFIHSYIFEYELYSQANYLKLKKVWEKGTDNKMQLIVGFGYDIQPINSINGTAIDFFGYNNGYSNPTTLISTNYPGFPFSSANRSVNNSAITSGILDTVYYNTSAKALYYYSPNNINNDFAPGLRVDSVKLISNENTLLSKSIYKYQDIHRAYNYPGFVNSIDLNSDNPACPSTNYKSELNHTENNNYYNYYYGKVELVKEDLTSKQITQEFYKEYFDTYLKVQPTLSKRIVFANGNYTDTLSIDSTEYIEKTADSLQVNWSAPGISYLASQFYPLDGQIVANSTTCDILYNGAAGKGILQPRVVLPNKQITKTFDNTTFANPLTTVKRNYYNANWQPSQIVQYKNNNDFDSIAIRYLFDNPTNLQVSNKVSSSNLYDYVTSKRVYNSTKYLYGDSNSFRIHNTDFVVQDQYYKLLQNNEIKNEGTILEYDTYLNPLFIKSKTGLYNKIINDYNGSYLTTNAVLTSKDTIAATSFEADGKGNFTYSGLPLVPSDKAPTGNKIYSLSGNSISKVVDATKNYIVSLWSNSSDVFVNGSAPVKIGRSLGSYTYREYSISGASLVTISGNANIDELRLYPQGSQITTYTYAPLIGLTSQCDANNRIVYYFYDAFNRLILVKDQDNNIVKKICYNYAGQPVDCNTPCVDTSANWQNTTTPLRCQQGPCGNTGYQEQEQKNINPCSATYNSTKWVVPVPSGYNPTLCTPGSCVTLSSNNVTGATGYVAVYTSTTPGAQPVTFSVPATTGVQTMGTLPPGTYNLSIYRNVGMAMYGSFKSGCNKFLITGTYANYSNINVSVTTCNSITVDISASY